jgi:predicted small lipoprotein YifL
MNTFSSILALSTLAILMVLSGCGQTGPLYLPDEDSKNTAKTVDTDTPKKT